jgi:hypothetical protein
MLNSYFPLINLSLSIQDREVGTNKISICMTIVDLDLAQKTVIKIFDDGLGIYYSGRALA